MIVSYAKNFIFLKTRKTASTSHEIALSSICEAKDIITPIRMKDEEIRKKMNFRGPQNIKIPTKYLSFRSNVVSKLGLKEYNYWNHMPGREAKKLIDRLGSSVLTSFELRRTQISVFLRLYFCLPHTQCVLVQIIHYFCDGF